MLLKADKSKKILFLFWTRSKKREKKVAKTETIGVYKKHEASYYYSQIPFFLVPFLSPIFPPPENHKKNQTRPKTFLELFWFFVSLLSAFFWFEKFFPSI